jgi:hypothetical protein
VHLLLQACGDGLPCDPRKVHEDWHGHNELFHTLILTLTGIFVAQKGHARTIDAHSGDDFSSKSSKCMIKSQHRCCALVATESVY